MEIKINNTYLITIEDIPKNIIDNYKIHIEDVVSSYLWELDTPKIRAEIKNKILKLLVKPIREEKLKKLNELTR